MLSSFLLSYREGLEAALVIGIILAYLIQINRKDLSRFVYIGAGLGALISIIGGVIGFKEAKELEEASEEVFEGIMMLTASGLIAYFVVWIGNQSRNISQSIKEKVSKSTNSAGLMTLSFISVFREGLELAIFTMSNIGAKSTSVALGSMSGIVIAIATAVVIFKTAVKLNLKIVFKVLGIVLIFVGAEMFGEGLVKFFPSAEEPLETAGMLLFALPSFYVFLKSDLSKYLKKI